MKACLPSNQCTVPENTKLLINLARKLEINQPVDPNSGQTCLIQAFLIQTLNTLVHAEK